MMRHAAVIEPKSLSLDRRDAAIVDGQAHLQLILDHLPIILLSAAPDGRITTCEGRGLALLGSDGIELLGKSIFDLLRDSRGDGRAHLQRELASGQSVVRTQRIGHRWHEIHLTPVGEPDGKMTTLLGVSLDITERRLAGQAHQESTSRLQTILAHAPMILWAVDRAGRVTLAEGTGLGALGLGGSKLIGRKLSELGDAAELMQMLQRVIDGVPFEGETRTSKPPRWYDTRCEPLLDDAGKRVGAIAVSMDVTARKEAEDVRDQSLRAMREALRGERAARRRATFLAQASRVLASSLDQDTTLHSLVRLVVPEIADGCAVQIIDPDHGAHRPVVAFHKPELEPELIEIAHRASTQRGAVLRRVLDGGEGFFAQRLPEAPILEAATPELKHDLLERLGMVSLATVGMKARGRILGMLSLFTVADSGRELEEDDAELAADLAVHAALAIDNARLYGEQMLAVQRRDEFLSVASHELRTPVTSVQLAIQAVARQNEKISGAAAPVTATMLKTAERQSRRLAQLVENLLDVSRIATGQLTMHREQVDLAELVRETAASLSVDAAQAGCAVTITAPTAVIGCWDRVRLEQVLVNLVSNAFKYGRGKPVELVVEHDTTVARLRVEDHGIGIAPDCQEMIFDRFERAVSAQHYGGFGLGLYIVKQIVTALGGSISVESELGNGATFTVVLPLDVKSGP